MSQSLLWQNSKKTQALFAAVFCGLKSGVFSHNKEKTMHDKDPVRHRRSLRGCHMPAELNSPHASPRPTAAYIPELASAIDNDKNLTDGARRGGRKLSEYIYRENRDGRCAEITVTYLM